ncbi:MAG: carbohydrate kinase family protein [Candidatus Portnoybacteria bacterium]|nr:carbohydrate kinase family protein [Candidatus Portnoybacteria bacterium]
MFDITTVGTVTLDTFMELDDVLYHETNEPQKRYYCLPLGGKVSIKNLEKHFGGNAANTAVGFSNLKLKTAIITSLGNCAECQSVITHLKTKKVDTSYVMISKECKQAEINTSFILDWHKNKQDRIILSYHRPKKFKPLSWPKTKWMYLTSLGVYFKDVVKQIPQSVSIAWNPGGCELAQGARFLLPVLRKTAVLILNKSEAAQLVNIQPHTINAEFLLNNLLKLGPRIAVITSGGSGAYAKDAHTREMYYEKGLTTEVHEVTGAGDAFASGFISAYIKQKGLKECIRWGILNASSCITKIGAQNGLLNLSSMRKFFKKHYT